MQTHTHTNLAGRQYTARVSQLRDELEDVYSTHPLATYADAVDYMLSDHCTTAYSFDDVAILARLARTLQ